MNKAKLYNLTYAEGSMLGYKHTTSCPPPPSPPPPPAPAPGPGP